MIFRRNVWDLPKGTLEKNESIEECAVREVTEEIGVEAPPRIEAQLAESYHEYERHDILFGKTTYWYVMRLPEETGIVFHPQKEEDIEKVAWLPLPKAKQMVGYNNLRKVILSFEKWFGN